MLAIETIDITAINNVNGLYTNLHHISALF